MSFKFKVGDKVKLVRLENENISLYKKYLGQEFEIKEIIDCQEPHCYLKENNSIVPFLKNLELVKNEYTYEDLKKSPIGTKITFENGGILIKDDKKNYENRGTWRNEKDFEKLEDNEKVLGKIIKIEEPTYQTVYEYKLEILDEAEKRYLRGVIRPFRDKVEFIKKLIFFNGKAKITIKIKNDGSTWYIGLPLFRKDTMYKGMEEDKEYTLEELGL